MFDKKKPPEINIPVSISSFVTTEMLQKELDQQKTVNKMLLHLISDLVNHRREELIIKRIDETQNFLDKMKKL